MKNVAIGLTDFPTSGKTNSHGVLAIVSFLRTNIQSSSKKKVIPLTQKLKEMLFAINT